MTQRHPDRKAREAARKAEAEAAREARYWFAPKRYGLGTGLPIRWQGWAVYSAYAAALGLSGLIDKAEFSGDHAVAMALFVLATTALLLIVPGRTRGGWKWRWGKQPDA